MKNKVKVLDAFALLNDIPLEGLSRGDVGTIVEILDESYYLAEFCDNQGRTHKMIELNADMIMKLNCAFESEFA